MPWGRLSDDGFEQVQRILHDGCGIFLQQDKRELVHTRLIGRLRELQLPDFQAYSRHLANDATELSHLVDALTTNKTGFFRERPHYRFLKAHAAQLRRDDGGPRLWSAGCASGEEPYSLAILLHELGLGDARILATDISATVLQRARQAAYPAQEIEPVPVALRQRWFEHAGDDLVRVRTRGRQSVSFVRLNLLARWPMRRPFHVIFCRNVMIYFDRDTRQRLLLRFHERLAPGGYLFIGMAEGLTGLQHPFHYIEPAVYQK